MRFVDLDLDLDLIIAGCVVGFVCLACSENPLDPDDLGELKTAFGTVDTTGAASAGCNNLCSEIFGLCLPYPQDFNGVQVNDEAECLSTCAILPVETQAQLEACTCLNIAAGCM